MSSLREEIKKLQAPTEAHAPTYVKALASVLAVIDAHEAKPRTLFGAQLAESKPSDERPARAVDVMAFTEIARQKAVTFGNYQGAVCELADAIDAIATAVLEGRK